MAQKEEKNDGQRSPGIWEVPESLSNPDTSVWLWDPIDLHHHFRDGKNLRSVAQDAVRQFSAAIAMPNLVPPVATVADAEKYRSEILQACPENIPFTPLMTLYLTDNTDPNDLLNISGSPSEGAVVACKLYPAGATTNSHNGVTDVKKIYPVLEVMQKLGILLLIHAEVTDPKVDIFDRERVFIETIVSKVVKAFPNLKVVLEHATSEYAVNFVLNANENVAASITCHHLLLNRNALFEGGLRPHHYCLPVLKTERDRQALVKAVTSGNPKFFLGTDSAPHVKNAKECCKGKAGCYTARNALELYAENFDAEGALDKLSAFASTFGPRFYGFKEVPVSSKVKVLRVLSKAKSPSIVPDEVPMGDSTVVPFRGGEPILFDLTQEFFIMDRVMTDVVAERKNIIKWSEDSLESTRQKWNDSVLKHASTVSAPELLKVEDLVASSSLGIKTSVRHYVPSEKAKHSPLIVYFHSGALLFGNVDTHDMVCRNLAYKSDRSVLSVDYRLCPENSFEDTLNDARNVVEWVLNSLSPNSKLVLAGDSSGALLALAASQYLSQKGQGSSVLQLIFWYPSVGVSEVPLIWDPKYINDRATIKKHVFTKKTSHESFAQYEVINTPDAEFKGLPPTLVVAAAFDSGCPYQVEFHRKLLRAQVQSKLWICQGLHGALFQLRMPTAMELLEKSAAFIAALH